MNNFERIKTNLNGEWVFQSKYFGVPFLVTNLKIKDKYLDFEFSRFEILKLSKTTISITTLNAVYTIQPFTEEYRLLYL